MMKKSHMRLSLLPLFLVTFFLCMPAYANGDAGATATGAEPPYYRVQDGKIDARTFMGWRVFHMNCHSCHGIDAVGTDVAPDLVERVKSMGPDTFATKVLKRYRITIGASQATGEMETAARDAIVEEMLRHQRGVEGEIVMPGWDEFNPGIRAHILDLYAYLKARADGALKPGRPEVIKEQE